MRPAATVALAAFLANPATPTFTGPAGRYAFDIPAPVRIETGTDRIVLDWSAKPRPIPDHSLQARPKGQTELQAAAADYGDAIRIALNTVAAAVDEGHLTDHTVAVEMVAYIRDGSKTRFGKALNDATHPHLQPGSTKIADHAAYAARLREAAQAMPTSQASPQAAP